MTLSVVRSPSQAFLGEQTRFLVGRLCRPFGSRVLVIADPAVAQSAAFGDIVAALKDSDLVIELFTEIRPELPVADLVAAVQVAEAFGPSALVGVGGGSAIDLAKLVAAMTTHGGALEDYYGESRLPGPSVPVIAVPTTAGTGTECSPVAVVTDPELGAKVGVSSTHLIPRVAVCDPVLTLTCPRAVTVHSGLDALSHAVESFTARPRADGEWDPVTDVFIGKNDVTDDHAITALGLLAGNLAQAVESPDDIAVRDRVMRGSFHAGVAFSHAGNGLAHALQYPVGSDTGTSHGLGVALLLPYCLADARDALSDEFVRMSVAVGIEPDPAGKAFLRWYDDLLTVLDMPRSLAEIGVEPADLPGLARRASTGTRLLRNHRRPTDEPSLVRVLERAWEGDHG
ncbi:iron-containing alcohol dehydrogenase [Phytohabitans kaempferiae]|uniref:Iron-containing alcohol dehydrogenase n=1 Tax=Phytohabitans kaempferiae TaxID=1620943 RepID=A0ABV6M3L6_9ACTN